ncbi:MAG: hypothetical protein KJ941_05405 [Bacteroidetes bacterium]|nr:hypothetical protein [Bacteroidota bacterium]
MNTIEYSISISEIAVVLLVILTSGLGYIIKKQHDRIKDIQSQLSEKKYNVYHEIFSIYFDLIKDSKTKKTISTEKLGIRIMDIKKDLLIYAPDNILQKFIEWTRYTNNNETTDMRHFLIYIELFRLIRMDMGYPKTTLSEDDVWKLIMTSDIEIAKMKALIHQEK